MNRIAASRFEGATQIVASARRVGRTQTMCRTKPSVEFSASLLMVSTVGMLVRVTEMTSSTRRAGATRVLRRLKESAQ